MFPQGGSLRPFRRTLQLICLAALAALPAARARAALVGYWDFNDPTSATIADLSTRGFNGTLLNGAAFTPSGGGHTGAPGDYAVAFDGVDDYVNVPVGVMNSKTQFTMAGWVKYAQLPTAKAGLFGENDVIEFGYNPITNVSLWTHNGGAAGFAIPAADNAWHHLAVTGDGAKLRLYLDGTLMDTAGSAITTDYGSAASPFNIGGHVWDATGGFFNGQIDDVAAWNNALSPAEITALANNTYTPLTLPEPTAPAMVAIATLALARRRRRRHS